MFDSKVFFVIIFLTALILGAAVYFQTMEMKEYKLLTKLDKQYLSGTFTGGAAETTEAPKADKAKKEEKKEAKKDVKK